MYVRRVVGHSDIMDAPRRREMGPPRTAESLPTLLQLVFNTCPGHRALSGITAALHPSPLLRRRARQRRLADGYYPWYARRATRVLGATGYLLEILPVIRALRYRCSPAIRRGR